MKNRVITATEFKAKCLALLDEIEEHGGTITVTKVSRAKKQPFLSSAGCLAEKGVIVGDIVNFRFVAGQMTISE